MIMDERKEHRLTVIERTTDKEDVIETPSKIVRQTNPIAKKLLEFHHEKISKFSVKDLFKN